ncbi:MAG: DNA repair protein RecN, partial [Clostridia bacterium]|nr:DNA repair protein RecN [Clostridia bacterium]
KNFAKISKQRQIVAISHLPQIVAMGDVGFLIEKKENQTSTITYVNRLDEKGKLGEVLRLVGGNDQSQAAINHASEMILEANDFKSQL